MKSPHADAQPEDPMQDGSLPELSGSLPPAHPPHLDLDLEIIRHLVREGGPQEPGDPAFGAWLEKIHRAMGRREIGPEHLSFIRSLFGPALSGETLQGMALTKPHGYAGDFEIIDRIYQGHVCEDPALVKWDRYYHQQAATKAVRNRKSYFHALLDSHYARRGSLRVLKIASGPGRSMYEWMSANPGAEVIFECVEIDPQAIEHARRLNAPFLDRVQFICKNALHYVPGTRFDLIWAAGIFDYFPDAIFLKLVRRLLPGLAEGGEMVIGNFSDRNPSRPYMEVMGEWRLFHRSAAELRALGERAGLPPASISLGSEPEGVNLFLHLGHPTRPGPAPH